MNPMYDIAWAAGFFDGEGCVSKTVKNPKYRLVVQQNVREPLEVLQKLFGGTLYGPYRRQRTGQGWSNPYWVWRLNRQEEVLYALQSMYPYLRVKQTDADRAIGSISG